MCGPTQAQTDLQSSQAAFYDTLQKQDAVQFGEDQQILTQMQSVYAPILAAGPSQYGFNPAEDTVLNTEATEGVAGNFAGASKALKEQQAAEGGGDSYLPSGVKQQQQEELDTSAAQTAANEKLQIKQSGFAQGYNQFTAATNALEGTAGLLSPTAAANAATSAGSAEGTTANAIAAENESWMAPLAGAVGAVGAAALTHKP